VLRRFTSEPIAPGGRNERYIYRQAHHAHRFLPEEAESAMPVVLVHGVPETPEVWDELRPLLGRESVALSLPGFGTPLPDGVAATKEFYVERLTDALRHVEGPIDLVGHDWGALLTARIATTWAVPLRSWVMDVACIYHPAYVWHDLAHWPSRRSTRRAPPRRCVAGACRRSTRWP
jgi:pimeloyl-ACP methyl ester carboxylesterase